MMGDWQAEVAKRIDIFATALHDKLRVAQMSDLDLSYTPPLGTPWDAVQAAAQTWEASRQAAGAGGLRSWTMRKHSVTTPMSP